MDGAYAEIANRFSIGKAIVSASTGLSSGEVEGAVDHPAGAGVFGQGMPVIRIREDCRSSETGKSRARAALAEQYPTSKRKSAPAPGLPASYADARGRPFIGRAAKTERERSCRARQIFRPDPKLRRQPMKHVQDESRRR